MSISNLWLIVAVMKFRAKSVSCACYLLVVPIVVNLNRRNPTYFPALLEVIQRACFYAVRDSFATLQLCVAELVRVSNYFIYTAPIFVQFFNFTKLLLAIQRKVLAKEVNMRALLPQLSRLDYLLLVKPRIYSIKKLTFLLCVASLFNFQLFFGFLRPSHTLVNLDLHIRSLNHTTVCIF